MRRTLRTCKASVIFWEAKSGVLKSPRSKSNYAGMDVVTLFVILTLPSGTQDTFARVDFNSTAKCVNAISEWKAVVERARGEGFPQDAQVRFLCAPPWQIEPLNRNRMDEAPHPYERLPLTLPPQDTRS